MSKSILAIALLACVVTLVAATAGDFNTIDFLASAPFCYHHNVGGGAFNDDSSGKSKDTVESLEAQDFRCGDIISHLIVVEMKNTVVDPVQDIQMLVSFLAHPTGQNGVAYGNIAGVTVNLPGKPVENGNNFTNPGGPNPAQPDGGCLGKFGSDGAAFSNSNEKVILVSRQLTKPIFTKAATLDCEVRITNLEARERVIVRVDVFIYCLPGAKATGNLQGSIKWKVSTADWSSISGGEQTVPLLGVGNIQGADCSVLVSPLQGQDFLADITTYTPQGGVIYSELKYSWSLGAYFINNVGSGTFELHTFVTECSYLHDGEYIYAQSDCGCESTKIGANQPQLFFNASGEYFDATPVSVVEPYTGLTLNKYTAIDPTQYITALYLTANGTVVRADWSDGRVMIFSNYRTATFTAADFARPTTPCTCRRRTDIAFVIERSGTVTEAQLTASKAFTNKAADQFLIDSDHNQIAVLTYGATSEGARTVLGINSGNNAANIHNAINSISCASKSACGSSGDGDVVVALNAAVAELQTSTRAFVGKVIVFVTNGWVNPAGEVSIAVEAARQAGIEVMVISYETVMMAIDMEVLTTNPDYVIQRFTVGNLELLDPIDLTSRICLINAFPCGSSCCGVCDTACGECRPVDTCPPAEGCSISKLVGNCCVNVSTGTCPDRNATCEVGVCDASSNTCSYTPTCQPPTGPGADGNCYDYQCVAATGSCVKTPKFESDECVVRSCVNNAIVTTNTTCPAGDLCTTWTCDPDVGCKSEPVNNTLPTAAPCTENVCVPASGWINRPISGCSATCTLNCGVSDQCAQRYCTGQTQAQWRCVVTNATCDAPSLCYDSTCDPALGCQFVPKDCDDNNPCTTDSCDASSGSCLHEAVVCDSPSLCSPSVCNNVTGACETTTTPCDDNIECTIDRCNPVTGACTHEANDFICDLQDKCNTYVCDNITAKSCIKSPVVCPDDGKYCTVAECVDFEGCNHQSLSCNNTHSSSDGATTDCSTVSCVEEEDKCVKEERRCASVAVITAAALTGGVIAGTVIGVIAFVACAGGASYAAFQQLNTGASNAVVNNPLYRAQGNQGTNPLFKEQ